MVQRDGVPINIAERRKPAHRMCDDQRLLELQFFDEAFDIADLALMAVVRGRFPFAIAMTALIERKAMIILPQHQADDVPGVSVQSSAVKKQDRRAAGGSPIEVMKPHPMDDDVMGLRKNYFGNFQSGMVGSEFEMFKLLGIGQHTLHSLVCFDLR